ncbi:MAG: hypothetical protein QM783_17615 [Phycisphaerales bacterium]
MSLAGEVGELEDRVDDRAAPAAIDVERRGEELQVFVDGEVVVNAQEVGHVADAVLDQLDLRRGVEPADVGDARVGADQARENFHRRAFACAVGPDEPEDLAGPDRQRQVVERDQGAVGLAELLDVDHGVSGVVCCGGSGACCVIGTAMR